MIANRNLVAGAPAAPKGKAFPFGIPRRPGLAKHNLRYQNKINR